MVLAHVYMHVVLFPHLPHTCGITTGVQESSWPGVKEGGHLEQSLSDASLLRQRRVCLHQGPAPVPGIVLL